MLDLSRISIGKCGQGSRFASLYWHEQRAAQLEDLSIVQYREFEAKILEKRHAVRKQSVDKKQYLLLKTKHIQFPFARSAKSCCRWGRKNAWLYSRFRCECETNQGSWPLSTIFSWTPRKSNKEQICALCCNLFSQKSESKQSTLG